METDSKLAWCARTCILSCLLLLLSGCSLTRSRTTWQPPSPLPTAEEIALASSSSSPGETSFSAGVLADEAGNPACVDHFYAAAAATWPTHAALASADNRGAELYRSAVQQFISSATRYGRMNATQGILLTSGQVVPICYRGFVWQPADFHTFLPVGAYDSPHIAIRYVTCGIGVPYVVLTSPTPRQPFINASQPFAATAVLEPSSNATGGCFALQFYDPHRTCVTDSGQPLARDLTAPSAYYASVNEGVGIDNFLVAYRDDTADGLHMREPYQFGKIPIVFVHGLASDPTTWVQLYNDLRAQPAIFSRYQFWMFRYDTGEPFLASAAQLRRQLATLRQVYDPCRVDPSLSQMVLIGHSLGGLVSKLQVTYSGNELWNAAATRPFETIVTDPATRADLGYASFFTPSPDISRVIFIATPHSGSIYARRCIGRLSSALVEEPPLWQARHSQLVRDNPGAFREELSDGIPTSVDLLEPDSEILAATTRLCFRPGVQLHSIIGDDRWSLSEGRSDGVVAVSSAQLLGVQSERFVDASHTEVQRRPETSQEVTRILFEHAGLCQ